MCDSRHIIEEGHNYRVKATGITRTTPPDTKTLYPHGHWTDNLSDVIRRYRNVEVCIPDEWKKEDVEYLSKETGVGYILAHTDPPVDISPLQEMSWLRGVVIHKAKYPAGFNFGELRGLEAASVTWNKKFTGLFDHVGIRTLLVDNYPYEDLRPLKGLGALVELNISSRRLKSLEGCAELHMLEKLELVCCPHLEISKSVELPRTLKHLSFHSAKSLTRLDPLAQLADLTYLHFLTCGTIESLGPVAGCRKLQTLDCLEVKFIDGDMSFIPRLPELVDLRFKFYKHYHPSELEITRPAWERRQARQQAENSATAR